MSSSAAAGAVGGKAARACDGCLRRRARWYCAADDAFLCQGCDASVHSANPLARRHERLRLRLRPLSSSGAGAAARVRRDRGRGDEVVPAWFKRKGRTPRSHARGVGPGQMLLRRLVVPEAAGGDSPEEESKCEGDVEEEQLLYRVPVFNPALAEFCSPPPLEEAAAAGSCCNENGAVEYPTKPSSPPPLFHDSFGPTDAELREFAADMEALLGRGLDDTNEENSLYMETLGFVEPTEAEGRRVKLETDGEARGILPSGLKPEPEESDEMLELDIDFHYGSPQETPEEMASSSGTCADSQSQLLQRSLALSLNYEAIIASWGSSPWTDGGERPHVELDDCWPHDYSGVWTVGGVHGNGGVAAVGTPRQGMDCAGREARVTRYREKRRMRLFSKKIRYEVRKLNAEKRPRMKGRFVKRATVPAAAATATAMACVA